MAGVEFRLDRNRTAAALMASRVVVVMTKDHVKTARHLVDTMWTVYQAGFVAEATMRIPEPIIRDAMPELINLRQAELEKGKTFVLGVGSITSDRDREVAAELGFDMLVGPGKMIGQKTDPYEVLGKLQKMGYFLAPAAATPSEFEDWLGPLFIPDAIKVYPADATKNLLPPCARPERQVIKVMPTGGVDDLTGPKQVKLIAKNGFIPMLGMSKPLEAVIKNQAPGDIPLIWRSIGDFIGSFLANNDQVPFGAIDQARFSLVCPG
jgi:2-keto-3-deoxy-6-phosphogluconate aldolase